jgi:hypothetical protein
VLVESVIVLHIVEKYIILVKGHTHFIKGIVFGSVTLRLPIISYLTTGRPADCCLIRWFPADSRLLGAFHAAVGSDGFDHEIRQLHGESTTERYQRRPFLASAGALSAAAFLSASSLAFSSASLFGFCKASSRSIGSGSSTASIVLDELVDLHDYLFVILLTDNGVIIHLFSNSPALSASSSAML